MALLAGPGARLGLDGCAALPANLTLGARGGALALANMAVPIHGLRTAYSSLATAVLGSSLALAAVTVPELPSGALDTGTLSVAPNQNDSKLIHTLGHLW
jgi:hypothetical protein